MSAYMNFFVRGGDNFYPIGTYSRSTAIYEMFSEYWIVPWEAITPITKSALVNIGVEVRDNIDGFNERIKKEHEKIEIIKEMNNDIGEKISKIEDQIEWIIELEERVEELRGVEGFISVLSDILREAEDSHYYEDESRWIDENMYVYVGIEVGRPTLEDIRE